MKVEMSKEKANERCGFGLFEPWTPMKSIRGRGLLCPRCGSRVGKRDKLCLACGQSISVGGVIWARTS